MELFGFENPSIALPGERFGLFESVGEADAGMKRLIDKDPQVAEFYDELKKVGGDPRKISEDTLRRLEEEDEDHGIKEFLRLAKIVQGAPKEEEAAQPPGSDEGQYIAWSLRVLQDAKDVKGAAEKSDHLTEVRDEYRRTGKIVLPGLARDRDNSSFFATFHGIVGKLGPSEFWTKQLKPAYKLAEDVDGNNDGTVERGEIQQFATKNGKKVEEVEDQLLHLSALGKSLWKVLEPDTERLTLLERVKMQEAGLKAFVDLIYKKLPPEMRAPLDEARSKNASLDDQMAIALELADQHLQTAPSTWEEMRGELFTTLWFNRDYIWHYMDKFPRLGLPRLKQLLTRVPRVPLLGGLVGGIFEFRTPYRNQSPVAPTNGTTAAAATGSSNGQAAAVTGPGSNGQPDAGVRSAASISEEAAAPAVGNGDSRIVRSSTVETSSRGRFRVGADGHLHPTAEIETSVVAAADEAGAGAAGNGRGRVVPSSTFETSSRGSFRLGADGQLHPTAEVEASVGGGSGSNGASNSGKTPPPESPLSAWRGLAKSNFGLLTFDHAARGFVHNVTAGDPDLEKNYNRVVDGLEGLIAYKILKPFFLPGGLRSLGTRATWGPAGRALGRLAIDVGLAYAAFDGFRGVAQEWKHSFGFSDKNRLVNWGFDAGALAVTTLYVGVFTLVGSRVLKGRKGLTAGLAAAAATAQTLKYVAPKAIEKGEKVFGELLGRPEVKRKGGTGERYTYETHYKLNEKPISEEEFKKLSASDKKRVKKERVLVRVFTGELEYDSKTNRPILEGGTFLHRWFQPDPGAKSVSEQDRILGFLNGIPTAEGNIKQGVLQNLKGLLGRQEVPLTDLRLGKSRTWQNKSGTKIGFRMEQSGTGPVYYLSFDKTERVITSAVPGKVAYTLRLIATRDNIQRQVNSLKKEGKPTDKLEAALGKVDEEIGTLSWEIENYLKSPKATEAKVEKSADAARPAASRSRDGGRAAPKAGTGKYNPFAPVR